SHRAAFKEDFASRGVKLSYTAYILMACAEAMKVAPEINSQWHADAVEIFSDVNIGVGTALGDKGLVVPVISRVQERNIFGIAKELQNITTKARDNKLKPADMRGGTFTISNHGVSGSLLASPIIINQPQSAILGVGKLEKRVVVRSMDGQDIMVIKPMAYVSLTIDHRVIDGHQTNAWLSEFVSTLENWGINEP
ncbi:MAG: 2-oxo acid dehydrogenase subunit E2, partial [Arenicella sp.]|nr:2-oxo acid dehydrogenase subunit E2 [Arenicella sp.]